MRHIRGAFYLLLMTLLAISSILIAGCNLSDSDRATSDDEDSLINDLETKPIIPMQLLADSNALVEGTEIRISDSGSVYIAGNYLDPAIYFYVENGSEINDRQLGSFLVKLNDDGSVDWHKLFPKERGVMGSEFAALTLADDSVFLGLNISGDSVGSQSMEAGFRDTRVQITCMNQDGEIQWANTWGDNWDIILDMCIDSSSSNYFYGMTISQDTGMPWHFLNEIGVDGNIGWSKQWLGDHPVRLAIDEEDRIFIIGMVNAELNQEESAIHLISYSPDRDNSSDNLVNIAGELELEDMAISNNGRILIAGSYESDLILNSTEIISGNGLRDIFLAQIERNGSIFWLRTWGGAGVDIARGIIVDQNEDVYICGIYCGQLEFDPSEEIVLHESASNQSEGSFSDAFLAKYDGSGDLIWVITWGDPGIDSCNDIAFDSSGRIHVTGSLEGGLMHRIVSADGEIIK